MIRLKAPHRITDTIITLPGSKSISNRCLILDHVLGMSAAFENLSDSEDTKVLLQALTDIRNGQKEINAGHAGTAMRFLTALLSVTEGEWTLTGSERMKQRPVADLVSAIKQLGGKISYPEKDGFPPLKIKGKKLDGGEVKLRSDISSQFISALLLISPKLKNGLKIILENNKVSWPYVGMTIELLRKCGAGVSSGEDHIKVTPYQGKNTVPDLFIESDWSAASYWYSVCALSPGSSITLRLLEKNSLQADSVLSSIYEQFGVSTTFDHQQVILNHNGNITTEFNYDFTDCPDIAQTVAVTCFALGIKSELIGLSTLKIKETDRISALKNELENFGAKVDATESSLTMEGRPLEGKDHNPVKTYGDHRMAMSFASLALVCRQVDIEDEKVVGKSYPAFWDHLQSLGFNVNLLP
jgi:3-phosphoshikimate 1-carboxyvinyltransferase